MGCGGVRDDLKELVRASGSRLLESGLTVGTWGNISACDREAGLMYITPSGMDYHKLQTSDIVVMDLEGRVVEGTRRPSVEHDMHRYVFRARKDVCAVVHTHPIFSTVFSCAGEDIPINIHDEAAGAFGDTVRCCEHRLPGSTELAQEVVRCLGAKANARLLHSHGAVCVGPNMDAAFNVATILEMVAEIYWRVRAMGAEYVPISGEDISAMQEFGRTKYGQR